MYRCSYCMELHHIDVYCKKCVQMDAYNLAIMFGPALMRPHDDDMGAMLKDMSDQCQIVESLIRHVSYQLSFGLMHFCL